LPKGKTNDFSEILRVYSQHRSIELSPQASLIKQLGKTKFCHK
jgi:hypothetical protein